MSSLPDDSPSPVFTCIVGRELTHTDELKKAMDKLAAFRPDSVVRKVTALSGRPDQDGTDFYLSHTAALLRLVGQGILHRDRARAHQRQPTFGTGEISDASLLGEALPVLVLSGRSLDMGVYMAVQTVCVFSTDNFMTVIGVLIISTPQERLTFLRNYGRALAQLAAEELIKRGRVVAFTNWLNLHREDVQTADFWEGRYSLLDDII